VLGLDPRRHQRLLLRECVVTLCCGRQPRPQHLLRVRARVRAGVRARTRARARARAKFGVRIRVKA
jgi:hypothetical protein